MIANGLGSAFSGISRKEDNLIRFTQIFKKCLLGISVPFDFLSGVSGIFCLMVYISEIQQLSDFPETFQGNFL